MLRQSLNYFIGKHFDTEEKNVALQKLNQLIHTEDFHRQLRNELIMIPIPKFLSTEYNENAPLSQAHYVHLALERVSCL